MRILLVEPDFRRNSKSILGRRLANKTLPKPPDDESLWYPPIGLMKLSTFHKRRGDTVEFYYGCMSKDSFGTTGSWDRIYITTLFTFHWAKVMKTINHYKSLVCGDTNRIFVGGIMASLLPKKICETTGISPVVGLLSSPQKIGLCGNENIDVMEPDYKLLDNNLYAINDTYYAYATRGCRNQCPWCGVPIIEPGGIRNINIKDTITNMRKKYGDKSKLKLMDNNILASQDLNKIVGDLVELGYGRNPAIGSDLHKERVIDFNQGLDATFLTEENMKVLAELNIRPMRIAFDRIGEKDEYIRAVKIAKKYGVKVFSNYMLYNYRDTPKDLYDRLVVNISLNKHWKDKQGKTTASIYSYPMRYAPIDSTESPTLISQDNGVSIPTRPVDDPASNVNGIFWTKRFVRNIEIMKGAAHGSISPTYGLAKRTLGRTFKEFVANLYMPEELLRNRNKYERKVYGSEPKRVSGTGEIEAFRRFIWKLARKHDQRFTDFHRVVSKNSKPAIRNFLKNCRDKEMIRWLTLYLK